MNVDTRRLFQQICTKWMLTQDGYSNKYAPNECWHKKVIPINMHQKWMLTQDGYSQICTKWMLTQDGYSNKYAPNECWHKKVIPINMHQMNVDTRWLFQ